MKDEAPVRKRQVDLLNRLPRRVPVMLSAAKHLLFFVENKKQILRADYNKVFR
jgi:hypothetical protein